MSTDKLEAVYEEAQRQLFSGAFAQRKSGEFFVNGMWIWFVRRSADEVTIKIDGEALDIIRED